MSDLIDRQAAIDALMEILDRPNHAEFLYTDEIYKALSTLPSTQPTQKNYSNTLDALDCVSRQAAIDAVQEALAKMEHSNYFHIWTTTEVRVMVVERILKQLPTAEPRCYLGSPCEYQNPEIKIPIPTAEPKTGRWIADGQKQKHGYEWMHCSVCGFSDIDVPATHTNYCPNCGARMEGEDNGI